MKVKELKEMTTEELEQQMVEIRKEQLGLVLQQSSGQIENPARIRELRRTVARIKTIQKQKVEG